MNYLYTKLWVQLRIWEKTWKKSTQSSRTQLKRVSSSQGTLWLQQYFIPSTCTNIHILPRSPINHQKPLYTNTKTDQWHVIFTTITDTKTRCRRKEVCRNCGEDDHTSEKTNKYAKESKCADCGKGHMTGSSNCEFEINETVIKKMQADSRVATLRAPQIMAEKMSLQDQTLIHTIHISNTKLIRKREEKFNPWASEKSFTQEIGNKPATKRSKNESEFVIEISN